MKTEKSDILTFLFWSNFAAFAAHLLDETVMAGGLVAFIQRHFCSGFTMPDFFNANAIWLILIAISNALYDGLGRRLAALPLAFLWERVFNALFHVGATFHFEEYCPGLVTGTLFFVLLYLTFRYGVLRKQVGWAAFLGAGVAAAIFETTFVSSMWWAH